MLGKYAKMIMVKIPIGSVLHKMKSDGVSLEQQKRFEMVFSANTSDQQSCMQNQTAGSAPSSASVLMSQPEMKAHQLFGKYAKMASIGLPVESVLHKMRSDSVTEDQINVFAKVFGHSTQGSTDLHDRSCGEGAGNKGAATGDGHGAGKGRRKSRRGIEAMDADRVAKSVFGRLRHRV